jgi:hypothetical protein
MNKTTLKIFVGLIAISLAFCAAFFSIVGLSKLFAGAALAVIIMASTLEASKLVIASFLYQFWDTVNKTLRGYLLVAVSIIMIITSIGIYGFLSGAYQTTKSKFDLTQTQVDSLTAKQLYYESSVNTFKIQLDSKNTQLSNLSSIRNSQEQRATQLITSNKSSNSADRSARQTDASIKTLNLEIDNLNSQIILYTDSVSKSKVAVTQLGLKNEMSSELGSLVYISKILNVPMNKVVNVLILLFIIVFDPLAICMVLAFNFLNKPENEENLESKTDEIHPEQPSEQPRIQPDLNLMDIESPIEEDQTIQPQIINDRSTEKAANLQRSIGGAVSVNTSQDNIKTY